MVLLCDNIGFVQANVVNVCMIASSEFIGYHHSRCDRRYVLRSDRTLYERVTWSSMSHCNVWPEAVYRCFTRMTLFTKLFTYLDQS